MINFVSMYFIPQTSEFINITLNFHIKIAKRN